MINDLLLIDLALIRQKSVGLNRLGEPLGVNGVYEIIVKFTKLTQKLVKTAQSVEIKQNLQELKFLGGHAWRLIPIYYYLYYYYYYYYYSN